MLVLTLILKINSYKFWNLCKIVKIQLSPCLPDMGKVQFSKCCPFPEEIRVTKAYDSCCRGTPELGDAGPGARFVCKRFSSLLYRHSRNRVTTYTNDDIDNDTLFEFVTIVKMQDLLEGKYYLIYAHPETLLGSKGIGKMLRSKLFKEYVCCTVVDEVHMISEWGSDFRKSFQRLGELTIIFPDKPNLAMTATTTKSAMESLTKILQFKDPNFIIENPDRPNIFIEVRERLPNLRKYEKQEKILSPLVTELKEKLLNFPVTVVYCDNLETVGYGYQYITSELGEYQYIPKEENYRKIGFSLNITKTILKK
ncbi:bifunctional 3'-5' exonuclease/ATP-dependent helicase WRN-like [Saccostrea cucullata]|uniref:bifunctional 3'-5' exonuclease/ATP-dependent helicase WRN-like n=1 Tax=Saccostrea cuccullata TaxID=36930 RepID=UPI002ED38D2A